MKLVSIIFYSEPHPIFYKYSERREQRQIENIVFKFGYAKAHPIFYKYTNFRSKANIGRDTEQKNGRKPCALVRSYISFASH